ncbi:MAG: alpha/beta hydrolase [Acidobacteria bacterium]|nr:alpha/beta hydrolase [Acidobacteriota bacterium]
MTLSRVRLQHALLIVLAIFVLVGSATAQSQDSTSWAAAVGSTYRVLPNITYVTANNWDAKLDIYVPRDLKAPNPTLVWIHGGGWVLGAKEGDILNLLPWIEMGWTVVNVEYRLGRVSLAPAAVEDCRCALRWVIRNAEQYKFDVTRLVVSGASAGGHLALTTGMLTSAAGLDRQCPSSFSAPLPPEKDEPRVSAIINWFGITDVGDLFGGPNTEGYAIAWFGSLPNRDEIAKRVSPLTYVRKDLPPILTIHGDNDNLVPYSHATRLHQALEKAGATNQLLTIPGGKHGGFTREEYLKIYATIREFLANNKIWTRPAAK